jgi:hypothetical protein
MWKFITGFSLPSGHGSQLCPLPGLESHLAALHHPGGESGNGRVHGRLMENRPTPEG